jgi:hypothetical protein
VALQKAAPRKKLRHALSALSAADVGADATNVAAAMTAAIADKTNVKAAVVTAAIDQTAMNLAANPVASSAKHANPANSGRMPDAAGNNGVRIVIPKTMLGLSLLASSAPMVDGTDAAGRRRVSEQTAPHQKSLQRLRSLRQRRAHRRRKAQTKNARGAVAGAADVVAERAVAMTTSQATMRRGSSSRLRRNRCRNLYRLPPQ